MRTFRKLSRKAIRLLNPGEKLSEHGITFDRLPDGDGKFTVEFMVDRVRIHKVIGLESDGITRTHAEEFVSSTRMDAHEDRLKLPKRRKVALALKHAAAKYLEKLQEEGGKDIPMKQHRLQKHIIPHLGRHSLSGISGLDIARYQKARRDEGASPGTINRELAVVSHLLSKAVEWTWIDKRPKLKKLKEGTGRIVYLTVGQCQRLLDAAWKYAPHVHLFCLIGIDTGMRKSEILSIRKEHIDLDRRVIYIPIAKAEPREQPITSRLRNYLKAWLKGVNDGSPWLFPFDEDRQKDIRGAFRRVVKLAGLDPQEITPHILRHTAISHLVQLGADLPTVMRVSGHKSLQMVQKYAHQDSPHIQSAMNRLEKRYKGKSSPAQLHRNYTERK